MTREEYELKMQKVKSLNGAIKYMAEYIDSLEQRNAELEQRVKELEESKTCNGCIWYDELHPSSCDCIEQCIRFKHGWDKDRYEQKDSE